MFARQSICSVVSLHSGMSGAVQPQELLKTAEQFRGNTISHHVKQSATARKPNSGCSFVTVSYTHLTLPTMAVV